MNIMSIISLVSPVCVEDRSVQVGLRPEWKRKRGSPNPLQPITGLRSAQQVTIVTSQQVTIVTAKQITIVTA